MFKRYIEIKYQNYIDHPRLRELCLNCGAEDCDGLCREYKNAVRDLLGVPHLRETMPKKKKEKREKRNYNYRKLHEINGEKHTLREWSEISGINYNTMYMRMYRYGMTLDEALGNPLRPIMHHPQIIEINGEAHTISEWAEITGQKVRCIYARLERGYTLEEAVTGRKR